MADYSQINYVEVAVFIVYLIIMIGFGVYFFFKASGGEKEYYLGSRELGPWVSALSAGASDMSAWVLMGLPGAIFWFGLGQVWIAVGLAAGYISAWLLVAPRLRQFSITAGDAITLPQYLTNRFLSKSKALQVVCAVIFIVAYTAYTAAHILACGRLFNIVFGMDQMLAMFISAFIIVAYTFLGGFKAVSWSDFFQGMLMLGALMAAPIFALMAIEPGAFAATVFPENYWNLLSSGQLDWASWSDILSGFGWGLGYFGMPHIVIRFMAIRSQREVRKSAAIGISWNLLILAFSVAAGIAGRVYLGDTLGFENRELVFIAMSRAIFPALISGVLLSAILAAAMSSADSKLLVSSSAFTADVYKPMLRKNASEGEMLWLGRFVVVIIAIAATLIAANPNGGTIMSLVGNAWGVFGAAFGPAILLSLFWKRFTFPGAVAGIIAGAATNIIWLVTPVLADTGLYEIIPGFIVGTLFAVVATLLSKKPDAEVEALYDRALELAD
ncbi:MAG: sodium/proline symporter PutP [Oscillospiraceae bacterium]|nr:sodium/proline symporter PutP [Oscillospiraceae bacterium]